MCVVFDPKKNCQVFNQLSHDLHGESPRVPGSGAGSISPLGSSTMAGLGAHLLQVKAAIGLTEPSDLMISWLRHVIRSMFGTHSFGGAVDRYNGYSMIQPYMA